MNLATFNQLNPEQARAELFACCGSDKWASQLMDYFPFDSEQTLLHRATETWYDKCFETDYLAAFSQHPKIGDLKSLKEKFAGKEQASVASATSDVIEQLAAANADYEAKNGFIFIVCATGKTASEMLDLLQRRLAHSRAEELAIAMGEQHKITIIRFKKLLTNANWSWLRPSHLTTHILDTSLGKPSKDIAISLQKIKNSTWETFAIGITNSDGRIADLLPAEKMLPSGNYKLLFDTAAYFAKQATKGFYPLVEITFTIADESHYHVPLLLNPFGYSTYRGS